jgi:hypothetical protein
MRIEVIAQRDSKEVEARHCTCYCRNEEKRRRIPESNLV